MRVCLCCLLLLLAGAYPRQLPEPRKAPRLRAAATADVPPSTKPDSSLSLDGLERRSLQTYSQLVQRCGGGADNHIMLIDGDNVRGKTKFRLTKQQLCYAVDRLVRGADLRRVCLYFDHSTKQTGYLLPDNPNGLAVVFSGPRNSVDNVIVRDIKYFQANQSCDVLVVTEDRELKKRCRRTSLSNNKYKAKKKILRDRRSAASKRSLNPEDTDVDEHTLSAAVPTPAAAAGRGLKELHIMDSPQFADMIMDMYFRNNSAAAAADAPLPEQLSPKLSAWLSNRETASKADTRRHRSSGLSSPAANVPIVGKNTLLRKEVDLRKRIDKLQLLEGRGNRGNDMKNRAKIDHLSTSLATIQRLLAELYDSDSSAVTSSSGSSSGSSELPPSPNLVQLKLREIATNRQKLLAEETWERVVLAEQYRFELEEAQRAYRGGFAASDNTRALGRYVSYLNDMAFNRIDYNL